MVALDNRGEKTTDIASTYIQVLIGLASGIITAVLAFYPDILTIKDLNFVALKISLMFFGFSIGAGLFGLGGLVHATSDTNVSMPSNTFRVMMPVSLQLILFGIAIGILLFVIP